MSENIVRVEAFGVVKMQTHTHIRTHSQQMIQLSPEN